MKNKPKEELLSPIYKTVCSAELQVSGSKQNIPNLRQQDK